MLFSFDVYQIENHNKIKNFLHKLQDIKFSKIHNMNTDTLYISAFQDPKLEFSLLENAFSLYLPKLKVSRKFINSFVEEEVIKYKAETGSEYTPKSLILDLREKALEKFKKEGALELRSADFLIYDNLFFASTNVGRIADYVLSYAKELNISPLNNQTLIANWSNYIRSIIDDTVHLKKVVVQEKEGKATLTNDLFKKQKDTEGTINLVAIDYDEYEITFYSNTPYRMKIKLIHGEPSLFGKYWELHTNEALKS